MSNVLLEKWVPTEVRTEMATLAQAIVTRGDKERGGYLYLLGKLTEEVGEFVEALEYDDEELGEELVDVLMLLTQISVLGDKDPKDLYLFTEEDIEKHDKSLVVGMGDFTIVIGGFMEVLMKTSFPARTTIMEKYAMSSTDRLLELSRRLVYLMDRELLREEPLFRADVIKGAAYKLNRLAKVHNIKQ